MFLDNFQLRLDKPEKIKERKAFGGHKKTKGIKIKTGLYAWNSLGIHSSFVLLYVAYLPTIDLLPPCIGGFIYTKHEFLSVLLQL